MRIVSRYLVMACLALAMAGDARAADPVEEFTRARRDLQPMLRSKQTSDRLEAIKRLQEFPLEDSVLLIYGALDDPEPRVRAAAYDTLVSMNENNEVCETLLHVARKAAQARNGPVAAAPSLAILLSSNLHSTQREVDEFLDDLGASKNSAPVIITMVDELAARHRPQDVSPLERLTKTRIFASHFGVRRAVVHALAHIPDKQALSVLIEILDRVGGEARADAVEHLSQVTGQIFGMETTAWQRWWRDAKDQFVYPTRSVELPYRGTLGESASGYYYGLPLFAERMVFVLDTSGSMTGPRIVAAKRELTKAINSLSDDVYFGIVVFNRSASVWQRQLVAAGAATKRAAVTFVNAQSPNASTASYDALEAAFAFDTEAIYFLSDGAPTGGKIVAPVDIVAAITAANKLRRISVYTIGVGAGFPGSPVDVFLKTLAEQNLGLYRRVDN